MVHIMWEFGLGDRLLRKCFPYFGFLYKHWVLPPFSNSWIIIIVWLYIALNRTLNIDCY